MQECRVKICGLTRPEDVVASVAAGADFLGFVFAPGSPRRVDARELASWLEDVRGDREVVGVFRDQSVQEVLACVEICDLDFVQLHGEEHGDAWKRLPVRLIEARIVHVGQVAQARFAGAAWAQLLDSGAGSGRAFDWSSAERVARADRVFLAGGLHPGNVGAAIQQVRPFAVDVSSGVEVRPGQKDPHALRAFVDSVRNVFASREMDR
jgi:phosphoribosylanthranilate isomerase